MSDEVKVNTNRNGAGSTGDGLQRGTANHEVIKSLQAKLAGITDPVLRIDLMNELARQIARRSPGNLAHAIALSETASELSAQEPFVGKPYRKGLAESLQNLGEFYIQLASYDMALSFLFKAQAFLKTLAAQAEQDAQVELEEPRATVLNAIGLTYMYLGQFSEALDFFFQAQQVNQRLQRRDGEAEVLHNLGTVYLRVQEYGRALDYLNQSLEIAIGEQLVWGNEGRWLPGLAFAEGQEKLALTAAQALEKLCTIYFRQNHYQKALAFGLKSVELYQEIGVSRGEAEVLTSLSDLYLAVGEIEKARGALETALELARQIGARFQIINAMLKLGEIHRQAGQLEKAREHLEQACQLASSINARQALYESHQSLSLLYKQIGDYQKALDHHEQYHAVWWEVFNQDTRNRLKNLEIVHQVETARKEAEISQLRNVTLQTEIQERLQAEAALVEANQQLQEEAAAREQLIADLNDFAYMVAHDLKTPLTNIALSAGLLRIGLAKMGEQTALTHAERVIWMVEKMNRIINELLVLASVRQEKVYPQALDMCQVVKDVEARLVHLVEERKVEIIKPSSWPVAIGYAPWVEEVWANYLSNAILYGGDPPRIEIGVDRVVEEGAGASATFVRYWVKDNGDGLSLEAQVGLFAPFNPRGTLRPKGHGLGLSIVRRIVEKLGGKVGVESQGVRGEGCQFYFTLPAIGEA